MTSFSIRMHACDESSNPSHIRVTIFAGPQDHSRGNCGTLTMWPDEARELFIRTRAELESSSTWNPADKV